MSLVDMPATGRVAQREQTRRRMLQAVQEIIVDEGMRGVRHRAVAERADVSLGTTTYHFQSIEELIVCAFQYWRESFQMVDNPFFQKTNKLLKPLAGEVASKSQRAGIVRELHQLSVDYVCDQLSGKRQDRIVELAFYHESLRSVALRALVLDSWQTEMDFLTHVYRLLGSARPESDGRIMFSLFRQLEQAAVIADLAEPDAPMIAETLGRHMSLCFDVDIPL